MGRVTLNWPLLLLTVPGTKLHCTGGARLVVECSIQSVAHPGQLNVNAAPFTLIPKAGNGTNTATVVEFAPAPQPFCAVTR